MLLVAIVCTIIGFNLGASHTKTVAVENKYICKSEMRKKQKVCYELKYDETRER